MLKLKQFYTLSIEELNESDFPLKYHRQNYDELVFVDKGSGNHLLNNSSVLYESGDLLIISKEDIHFFEPRTQTRIVAIKFTDSYFKNHNHDTFYKDLLVNPESIMNSNSLKEIKIVFDADMKLLLRQTIDNIVIYNSKKESSSSPFVFYQILSIFGMIKETMNSVFFSKTVNLPAEEKLTAYIHQHIYQPEKIKIKNIVQHFNISRSYFSSYFKRKFDISFRDYINQYRLRLIEQRLKSRKFSIKEISNEFGFNDESHFSHYYRNNRGYSPSMYIKSIKG